MKMLNNENPVVLVFDEEQDIAALLQQPSKTLPINCHHFDSAVNFASIVNTMSPDLLLLEATTIAKYDLDINALVTEMNHQLLPIIVIQATSDIEAKIKALEAGVADIISKPFHTTETLARVHSAIKKKKYQDLLLCNSQLDPDTGLWTQEHFEQRLHEHIAGYLRYERYFSVILVDIDHPENINPTTLNEQIAQTTKIIKANYRTCDIASHFSHTTFAILLSATDEQGCRIVTNRIKTAAQALSNNTPNIPALTFSMAILPYEQIKELKEALTVEHLMMAASIVLRNIREQGGNGTGIPDGEDFILAENMFTDKEKAKIAKAHLIYHNEIAWSHDHQVLSLLLEKKELVGALCTMTQQLADILETSHNFLFSQTPNRKHMDCIYASEICTLFRNYTDIANNSLLQQVINSRVYLTYHCNQGWDQAFPGIELNISGSFLLTPVVFKAQVIAIFGFFFPSDKQHNIEFAKRVLEHYCVLGTLFLDKNHQLVAAQKEINEWRVIEHDLQKAKIKAEQDNLAKSTFLANMSHELRTPLNAIIGYSEFLIEENEDKELDEDDHLISDLARIQSSGKHLLGLINSILDLSKVESGKSQLYLENINLITLLEAVCDTVHPQIERNNNLFVKNYLDIPKVVYLDQTKLAQILINILGNAAKFTENGEIELCVRKEDRPDGGWIIFSISDTGIGMTMEQTNKIFSPFIQADSSMTRKFGGTGLGLAISKSFCEMMKGNIRVDSVLEKGTVFTISMPCRIYEERPELLTPKMTATHHSSPYLLLISEQEPLIAQISALDQFQVTTTQTLRQALQQSIAIRPDIILLDSEIPGKYSDFFHSLSEEQITHSLPVILITDQGKELELLENLDTISIDFLIRPFSLIEMQTRIRSLLRTKRFMDMLEERAQIDALTNLWNYAHFLNRLDAEIVSFNRYQRHFSIIQIKIVNLWERCQNEQHDQDEILIGTGNALKNLCRICDVPCRVGATEFAIILPETRHIGLEPFQNRILKDINQIVNDHLSPAKGNDSFQIIAAGLSTCQFEKASMVTRKTFIEQMKVVLAQNSM